MTENLSPYHAELAVASGKPTSGLPIWRFTNGSFYESGLDLREHGIGLLTQKPQT